MSKKDYCAVAGVIEAVLKTDGCVGTLLAVSERLAHEFKKDNPRFDPPTFYSACGFEVGSVAADDFKQGVGVVSYYPMVKGGG
jgi:hypothetical protein